MNFENDNIKKPLVGIGQIPQKKQTKKKKSHKEKNISCQNNKFMQQ